MRRQAKELEDYLSTFSMRELRELAEQSAPGGLNAHHGHRPQLLRHLGETLSHPDAVYRNLCGVDLHALRLLLRVLRSTGRFDAADVRRELQLSPEALRAVLECLRERALVFPQGDWDHPAVPACVAPFAGEIASALVTGSLQLPRPAPSEQASFRERQGSLERDLAEFLAQVSRSQMAVTQAGRFNRRDLQSIGNSLAITAPGYVDWLSALATGMGLVGTLSDGRLSIAPGADALFLLPPEARRDMLLSAWLSAWDDPEAFYNPSGLTRSSSRRRGVATAIRLLSPGQAVAMQDLAEAARALAPLAFAGLSRDQVLRVVSRLAFDCFQLGRARLDSTSPELFVGVSLRMDGTPPEEPLFYIQPNAEVFAPPNLAPRSFYHLRRLTGEKRGAPEGVYPLTRDSLRRALDSGLRLEAILEFLEAFSRTGLPDNVRLMAQDVARQHGRIRLVPASLVLVAEDAALLREIGSVRQLKGTLGTQLTERSVAVEERDAKELLKRLRAAGHAPRDETRETRTPPLPVTPEAVSEQAP